MKARARARKPGSPGFSPDSGRRGSDVVNEDEDARPGERLRATGDVSSPLDVETDIPASAEAPATDTPESPGLLSFVQERGCDGEDCPGAARCRLCPMGPQGNPFGFLSLSRDDPYETYLPSCDTFRR